MQATSLSPFSVSKYNRDYLIEFVRYTTRWHDRGEVAKKAQLQYICSYLEVDHIGCETVVSEAEYIDRHFLEDYSEYYARCFPSHPRKCARLHFFSSCFSEQEFRAALNNSDDKFILMLQESYLGFAVIRPIPHTVFARVCLVPYKGILENPNGRIITRPATASLFGIQLTVNALPFIEQDKVVSACATSALWVALSANNEMPLNSIPSPSHITKSASVGSTEATRTFPTTGLFPAQILRGLRCFGLEASIAWNNKSTISELKSLLYAHLKNDTPVILGGELYRKEKESAQYVGPHLICAAGYSMEITDRQKNDSLNLWSEFIDKLYVHDDRCGPYLRLTMKEAEFLCGRDTLTGFEMGVKNHGTWYFKPTIAIIGIYHKIRITHKQVLDMCKAFHWCLMAELSQTETLLKKKLADEAIVDNKKALEIATKASWDIHIVNGTKLKEDIWVSGEFFSHNGVPDKSSILASSMPKYIWMCRITEVVRGEAKRFADLLFDATEIPQGQVLLGYVAHSEQAHLLWAFIENNIKNRSWPSYNADKPFIEENISSFLRFFANETNSGYLNSLYGPIGIPRRPLKDGERAPTSHVSRRTDLMVIRRGEHGRRWTDLDKKIKYIWVINEAGDIVIGEDVSSNNAFLGHPTLLDGKPGRIAGELYFNRKSKKWVINLKSRAYSSHINPEDRCQYLDNVIKNNLEGLPVMMEDDCQ
jgi:hypothetical protein